MAIVKKRESFCDLVMAKKAQQAGGRIRRFVYSAFGQKDYYNLDLTSITIYE
ncbi:hypothetical protein [Desulfosporosinus fructosivorans]